MGPASVKQSDRPCELHSVHSPVTVINELHHIFPQELQKKLWGEVRDGRLMSLCATSHNTVTYAWQIFLRYDFEWPHWCIGKTRDVCELGWTRYLEACKELGVEP